MSHEALLCIVFVAFRVMARVMSGNEEGYDTPISRLVRLNAPNFPWEVCAMGRMPYSLDIRTLSNTHRNTNRIKTGAFSSAVHKPKNG